ncbi:glycosyltransferase [Muriicola soli]|uniref:Glycosyltransferase n=1 Tax=Muriicola soli TaxID=2507538 RepID=A0A411E8V2_9FLAO|nr:glycosyltransferase [Muriicola soli]QBA63890.1 glycosyltransferase [Muriicola soli]
MKKYSRAILLIIPYGSVGGMERLSTYFYDYYLNKGYKVKVLKIIKLENDIINFNENEYALSEKDLYEMSKFQRLRFYLKAPIRIRKMIKKYSIEYTISFGDMANLFSSLTLSSETKIGSIHSFKSIELSNKTILNKIYTYAYKSSYRSFHKVVCISKTIKEDLLTKCGYRFNNLKVIYNPHDIGKIIKNSNEKITEIQEKKIFSSDCIVFIGRLSKEKAPWHLINAFNFVHKKRKDINLVFIGDGDPVISNYIDNLVHEFGLNNNVFFLGRRSNPYKYIKASRVLALSSHYEGTPNVIIEAIAVGTPVVSSHSTNGIIELMSYRLLERNGEFIITESGIITPNLYKGELGIPKESGFLDEEVELADALLEVISNIEYHTKLNKNKSALLSKYKLERIAEEYLL